MSLIKEKYFKGLKLLHVKNRKFSLEFKCVAPQVVPVPLDRCTTEDIKEAFTVQAQEQQMELMEIPQHTDLKQVPTPCSFFFFQKYVNRM